MSERQEQNLQEIQTSLENTIDWMRKRQPSDWAKAHVPGEPHRYGTLHLYLLLRIEERLGELLDYLQGRDKAQAEADAEARVVAEQLQATLEKVERHKRT